MDHMEIWFALVKQKPCVCALLIYTYPPFPPVEPFPCMPVYFWDDPKNEKYKSAYFSRFEGVWYHGDFVCVMAESLGVVMLGRSDGTLNPGGVRFGSAELYNISK